MATFPSISPSYGVEKTSQPVVKEVQFGDGYVATLRYGLNQDKRTWAVPFINVTEADADTIETFLDARASDGASFDWTPPNDAAGKFRCRQWSKTIPYPTRATINCVFVQVFEP